MPTVTLNREVFERLVGRKLPVDKLRDRIAYLGTDLEKIDTKEIHVEVFPNRPDMLSEQGFARAFSAFIGEQTGLKTYDVKKSGERVIIDRSVSHVRPCTVCAIVRNICFDDEKIREIIQIQEKLHVTFCRNRKKAAIGIYPFEAIRPPIRYLAKRPKEIRFRPLEYPAELDGMQILSKHPAGREYGHLLEGKAVFPVFIDSADNVLSVPPIINSHLTGKITEKSRDVFIECSGFDRHALSKLLNILVTAMADMGGSVESMELEYPDATIVTPDLTPARMRLDVSYINRWLGLSLSEGECVALLERMGYGYDEKSNDVLIAAYRADILHPSDLAEDVAIAYGYENFTAEIPNVATVGREDGLAVFMGKLARILVGLGLLETNSTTVTSKEHQTAKMNAPVSLIEIKNSVTQEANCLKAWLIPGILETLAANRHNDYPQRLFEIGRIVKRDAASETGTAEAMRLVVGLSHNSADFTEIKQVLDYLSGMLDVKYSIRPVGHGSFIPGRVGRVSMRGRDVAYIGELHPDVLRNFGLSMPVAVLELNVTDLFGLLKKSV